MSFNFVKVSILAKEDVKEKIPTEEKESVSNGLDLALKNRILNLILVPIEKLDKRNINLLDYIGFVDEDNIIE